MNAGRPAARAHLTRLGLEGGGVGLAETALAFAALHGRPGDAARLDRLADGLDGINGAEARARALAGRLGRFHLCEDEAPQFSEVLERGAGSATALAILWLEVAWRAGWEAEALAFPGMLPVRLTDATGHRAIADPAAHGRLLQAADLRAALKAVEGAAAELRPQHFASLDNRDILLRLQTDVKMKALLAGHVAEAVAVVEGVLAFAPDEAALWREAGMMHLRLDNVAAAIAALEQFAVRTANGTARRRTQQLLQDLRSRMP